MIPAEKASVPETHDGRAASPSRRGCGAADVATRSGRCANGDAPAVAPRGGHASSGARDLAPATWNLGAPPETITFIGNWPPRADGGGLNVSEVSS